MIFLSIVCLYTGSENENLDKPFGSVVIQLKNVNNSLAGSAEVSIVQGANVRAAASFARVLESTPDDAADFSTNISYAVPEHNSLTQGRPMNVGINWFLLKDGCIQNGLSYGSFDISYSQKTQCEYLDVINAHGVSFTVLL